ncbi:hypothetical protein WK39_26515 [Burkholderia cepacia]|uniref:hypothetical protein n=1 Tax=Burkholderia cepacia TaxID=292 RepID=UPI00075E1D6B|nr:hypothetical protein [Burkholderia cepacia]KVS52215.1 hypothetical protein WK39_26515 [Burkholderia cepacia]KVS54365.1 hypothetical protein WK40_31860 [Burkholderia cepacia]
MTTEATLTLSADQQAVARKKISDMHHAVATILSVLKEGAEIDAELATNCVKVAEFNLADLCKTLGVETFSAKEREQRYADLRAANIRIHDLETQLGSTVAPEALQSALKNISEHLNRWWLRDGFGYVHDLQFGAYGVCHGKFSCSLHGAFPILDSDTPVSDKRSRASWLESLRARGFELVRDDRDWAIADCDANRAALVDLITKNIPSAKVFKFENVNRWRSSGFVLRHAEVYINQLAEILALPVVANEE